jgi:hypothetical protein
MRRDADAGFAVVRVEDVRAVPGRGHPGGDDRLRGREPERAPRDVLADFVADLRAVDVAAGAHAIHGRLAVGREVREVVFAGHGFAVALRGAHELRVGRQGALAVRFAFAIDEAEGRFADRPEVAGLRGQVGVRAGARGAGGHRGDLGGGRRARGRGGRRDLRCQEEERGAEQEGRCAQESRWA